MLGAGREAATMYVQATLLVVVVWVIVYVLRGHVELVVTAG